MKKILQFIKNNKLLTLFLILCLILFVFFIRVIVAFTQDDQKAFYGNRLEGIEKVEIDTNSASKKIKSSFGDIIKTAKIRIQGRIINITLDLSDNTSRDTIKSEAMKCLDAFDKTEKEYYDIQIFVTKTANTEDKKQFPIIGYKNHAKKEFKWTKDRTGNEE